MDNVLDWRKLDLKQNIHYCDENKSTDTPEPDQVYQKNDKWFLSMNRKIHKSRIVTAEQLTENMNNNSVPEISYCPYCGIDLNTIKE